MKGLDRFNLIDQIGRELQSTMTTTDINVYLAGFDVPVENVGIVDSKWKYVKSLLSTAPDSTVLKIAQELNLPVPQETTSVSVPFDNLLSDQGLQICRDDFESAFRQIDKDPSLAIGMASTTLETLCKSLLDYFNETYPKDESLQPLLKKIFEKMNLSPDGHADPDIKRVLGGLYNVGVGLGTLRTKYSSFHGRGMNQMRLGHRHARLAVSSMSTVGVFLLETYLERFLDSTERLPG